MTGNNDYDNLYLNKINNLIDHNKKDKLIICGFVNFLGNSVSLSTKYNYLLHVISFLNYVGNEKICLDSYTCFLGTIERRSPSYQIAVYSALKRFSNYMFISERSNKDYMISIKRPDSTEKLSTVEKREKGFLTDEEIKEYIATINNGVGSKRARTFQNNWKERDLLIILMLINTGMRCSALYKLDINSIDISNHTITVTEKRGKIRNYSFSPQLDVYICDWLRKREKILNGNQEQEDALFLSNQRKRLDQSSIARIVKKYAINIEGKTITPHKLRATYGTMLYNKTNDIYFVQKCMGHSNPKTTELYIRGNKNEMERAASEIITKIIF